MCLPSGQKTRTKRATLSVDRKRAGGTIFLGEFEGIFEHSIKRVSIDTFTAQQNGGESGEESRGFPQTESQHFLDNREHHDHEVR